MTATFEFRHAGFCDICETNVVFVAKQRWFRDHLVCPGCLSVPRERALMQVLKLYFPEYRTKKIHESSPCGRGVSMRLARECTNYSSSHFFPNQPLGSHNQKFNVRNESLEALTFADASLDLIITQDVMEHVLNSEAAFREIARVLKPGGAHVFTVPLVRKNEASRPRAVSRDDQTIEYLLDKQYHGNPVDETGSLVTMDWGYDIVQFIMKASSMPSQIIYTDDIGRGIRAEYIDVVISHKR